MAEEVLNDAGLNRPVKKIHNPYDSLFKRFMSDPNNARDFFRKNLPKKLLRRLDLTRLELCPQSFVDQHLKHKHVDVLYKTVLDGDKPCYIYVLTEAQKEPEKLMPLRTMHYCILGIENHLKQENTDTFPIIFPIIYYLGKKEYPYSTSFFDGFGEHKDLALSIYTNPFHVIPIVGTTEEELRNHPLAGTLSKIFELAYTRDLLNDLLDLKEALRYIDSHDGSNLVVSMVEFILGRGVDVDANQVVNMVTQMVSPDTGGKIMTLSDQLIQQGVEQGMEQGMQQGMEASLHEVAIRMLRQGEKLDLITAYTGLSDVVLKSLKASLNPVEH